MKLTSKLFLPCCLACALLLIAGGCGTINKIVYYNENVGTDKICFATTTDFNAMEHLWERAPLLGLITTPFWILDLPISIAADIIMLPLDIYWDVIYLDVIREKRKARRSISNEASDPQ